MAKPRHILEDDLGRLHSIADAPESHDLKRDLTPFLRNKSNHVIAAAADLCGRLQAADLVPELQAAFEQLMQNASKRDPSSKAMIAITKALIELDARPASLFFAGLKHVQPEASFGARVDAAAPLRGFCARGLARMDHPEALEAIVDLLADPEVPARLGAVQALAETGRHEAELLLRLVLLKGDAMEVMSESLTALLSLAPRSSVEFVGRFLSRDAGELREAAALALGESRQPAALPLLQQAYAIHREQGFRRTLLLSIALLRCDEGVDFVLSRLAGEPEPLAAAALDALAIYSSDAPVRERVLAILEERNSTSLKERFASQR